MKSFLLLLFFSVLFYFASFAQKNDIETLKKLNYDWLNSYRTKDTATISNILADDFMLISYTGIKQNKKDILDLALDPNVETFSVSFDSVDVKLVAPVVGILNGWVNYSFKVNEKEIKGKNCYQDVFIKRNGKWLAITAHVTSLGM